MVVLCNEIFRIIRHCIFDASQERQSTLFSSRLPSFDNVCVLVDVYKICAGRLSIPTHNGQQRCTRIYVCLLYIGCSTVHKCLQI